MAKRLGPLAEGVPRSLRAAVRMHRVPAELEADLMCALCSRYVLREHLRVCLSTVCEHLRFLQTASSCNVILNPHTSNCICEA